MLFVSKYRQFIKIMKIVLAKFFCGHVLAIIYISIFSSRAYLVTALPQLSVFARSLDCPKLPECRKEMAIPDMAVLNQNRQTAGETMGSPKFLTECVRKLSISIQVSNEGKVSGDEEIVVIDEVIDPITQNATSLANPLLLKIQLIQPEIIYPLKFQQLVNGGVYEEIIVGKKDEVCGETMAGFYSYNYSPIPFSEGFCCSCDESQHRPARSNKKHRRSRVVIRQLNLLSHEKRGVRTNLSHIKSLACLQMARNRSSQFLFETDSLILRNQDFCRKSQVELVYKTLKEGTSPPRSLKKRGTESLRARVDRERLKKYHKKRNYPKRPRRCLDVDQKNSSAHFLRLSDLWYGVYAFEKPIIMQEMRLRVFQSKNADDGSNYWTDLTRGNAIRLGSEYPFASDDSQSFAMFYSSSLDGNGFCEEGCPIDYKSQVILVPSHVHESMLADHPEATGGPAEYLVVAADDISLDGSKCDRIGTSFEGFVNQPNRCQENEGSCLKNQPVDLWKQDLEKRMRGEKGRFFLENFGTVVNTSIESEDVLFQKNSISLEYWAPFTSSIELEVRADSNPIIREGWNIQIQSITTDSTASGFSVAEVVVINNGLVFGAFYPWLVDCSEALPLEEIPEGPIAYISPLQRHVFLIFLEGSLPVSSVICTVEIHNNRQERVASRQVLIMKEVRCLCAFHCSCTCSTAAPKFSCSPLMQEEFAAAGYLSGLPRSAGIPPQVPLIITPLNTIAATIFVLILLGKIKAVSVCCCREVSEFGLNFLRRYLSVIIQERTLNRLGATILMNTFFFFLYPIFTILHLFNTSPPFPAEPFPSQEVTEGKISTGQEGTEAGLRRFYLEEEDDTRYIVSYLEAKREKMH